MTEQDRPALLNSGQVAKMLGQKQPNVHRFLERRGVKAVADSPHPIGKLYDASEIERIRDEWLADERAREGDEKRRQAALSKQNP